MSMSQIGRIAVIAVLAVAISRRVPVLNQLV